jgi:hypothetical protein
MHSRSRRLAQLLSLVACVTATPLAAQMAAPDPALVGIAPVVAPPVPEAPAVGPTMASARLGYSSATEAPTEMTWDSRASSNKNTGRVLAIVGGAAVIGGLLIDDDAGTAIAVGGLIMGLIGLYLWLK